MRGVGEYRVQLDVFSGPLDLLLYLIRRDEIDVQDVSITRLTDQYLEHVHVLRDIDPNVAGDFLVMASTLIELKSRALLPTPPLEALDEADDPRAALVRQLLEYKRFKDAARRLGTAADDRARRFVRRPAELPAELAGVELEEVEIWDLLGAFGKVMSAIGQGPGVSEIRYTDTPIEVYVNTVLETLEFAGPTRFNDLFADRTDRGEIIGLFLALLELIRRQRIRAEQTAAFGEIYMFLMDPADVETDEALNAEEAAALGGGGALTDAALDDYDVHRPGVTIEAGMDGGPGGAAAEPSDPAKLAAAAASAMELFEEAAEAAANQEGPAYFVADAGEHTLVVRLDGQGANGGDAEGDARGGGRE